MNAAVYLPKKGSENIWKTAVKKNGSRIAPEIGTKQCHDVLNHSHDKIIDWFRSEYPAAMQHMENLSVVHKHKSFPPCSQGKATRSPFKQLEQNRYALLEAVSSDTTGPITPVDSEGKKFVQIMVDACSGWTDFQTMAKKSEAANAIMRSLAKIQRICDMKTK